jgi:hypothetical protein
MIDGKDVVSFATETGTLALPAIEFHRIRRYRPYHGREKVAPRINRNAPPTKPLRPPCTLKNMNNIQPWMDTENKGVTDPRYGSHPALGGTCHPHTTSTWVDHPNLAEANALPARTFILFKQQ